VSLHLLLALITLVLAGLIDLLTRRIPNLLLGVALVLHLVISVSFERPVLGWNLFAFYLGSLTLLFASRRLRVHILGTIGMGDIKLVGYLILFMVPHLNLFEWLMGMASVATLTLLLLLLRGRSQSSIPFAPLLTLGTLVALG
jgi:Flp pilus assembly protein protease CpaA